MRTTLDLDDELLAEAKALAARERLSLTRLIEQGLALRWRTRAATPRCGMRPMACRRHDPRCERAGGGGLSAPGDPP